MSLGPIFGFVVSLYLRIMGLVREVPRLCNLAHMLRGNLRLRPLACPVTAVSRLVLHPFVGRSTKAQLGPSTMRGRSRRWPWNRTTQRVR